MVRHDSLAPLTAMAACPKPGTLCNNPEALPDDSEISSRGAENQEPYGAVPPVETDGAVCLTKTLLRYSGVPLETEV